MVRVNLTSWSPPSESVKLTLRTPRRPSHSRRRCLRGKLICHVFGALTAFERDLIRERTHAGRAAARPRGRVGGRPKALTHPKQIALAQELYDGGLTDVATICRTLGISPSTLYRYLDRPEGRHRVLKKSDRQR